MNHGVRSCRMTAVISLSVIQDSPPPICECDRIAEDTATRYRGAVGEHAGRFLRLWGNRACYLFVVHNAVAS